MYWWRLSRLKDQLRAGPMPSRQALSYLLATLILYSIPTFVPGDTSESLTRLDWAFTVAAWIISIAGTWAVYRANGGTTGEDFLARYLSLGWVLLVRFAVFLAIPAVLIGAAVPLLLLTGPLTPEAGFEQFFEQADPWLMLGFNVVLPATFFWRLGHHVGDVATGTVQGMLDEG
jgi:hypothetical protein